MKKGRLFLKNDNIRSFTFYFFLSPYFYSEITSSFILSTLYYHIPQTQFRLLLRRWKHFLHYWSFGQGIHCWFLVVNLDKLFNKQQSPMKCNTLTYWGRVMHICSSNLTIIGSCRLVVAKPLSASMLEYCLIGPLETNFNDILIQIETFSFKKMHLKVLSAKWQPFCLSLIVLILMWCYLTITTDGNW